MLIIKMPVTVYRFTTERKKRLLKLKSRIVVLQVRERRTICIKLTIYLS